MKSKKCVYWGCVVLSVIATFFEVYYFYNQEVLVYLITINRLTIIVGAFTWVYFDSKERDVTLTWGGIICLFLFSIIAVPIYFILSRGYRNGMKSGFGLVLYLPFIGLHFVTWDLSIFILQQLGYYS